MGEQSTVAVVRCSSYDVETIRNALIRGLGLIGGLGRFAQPGENILLKPNVLAPDPPETATITHPAVLEATAGLLLDHGVRVSYGDSPGIHAVSKTLKKTGFHDIGERMGLNAADFETRTKVFASNAKQNKIFHVADGVLRADGMISLPKLKTHGLTLFTGAIKNQFGCLPGLQKSGFHAKLEDIERFSQMLVDLTGFLKPRLFIMDGIRAMEGNGPRRGTVVDLGILLLSSDPVALDTVASKIIGLDPGRIIPIVKGHESGLGTMTDIVTRGDADHLSAGKFKLPRYSGNYRTLPPFIRNTLKKLLVQSPVINVRKCIKCYECIKICPTMPKSIIIDDKKYPKHKYSTCIRCYCCQETCPEGAITIKTKLFGSS